MTHFFSIIIPAYNLEKYINRAISSILNQSFQDFEIIIINDGSIDKTADVIDEYIKKTEKIKVITHLKNESLHISRMDGVAPSTGQYVLFLDGDDYFTHNALDILYNKIQKNPGYDFYEFGFIRQPSGYKKFPSFTGKDRFIAYFSKDNVPRYTIWNKVYETNFLKKAYAVMERVYINYAEDVYGSIVIAYYAKKIYQIKNIIINYQLGTGISTTYKDYERTISFMESIKTLNILLNNFLKNTNQNIKLDNLNYKFFKDAITYILAQKNNDEINKLFQMLPEYFDSKIILDYLFDIENSYRTIINSKHYKLFQKILSPFRKLKRLLI